MTAQQAKLFRKERLDSEEISTNQDDIFDNAKYARNRFIDFLFATLDLDTALEIIHKRRNMNRGRHQ